MKNVILMALATVLAFASCVEEMSTPETVSSELYAQMEQEDQTKTVMDENNNLRWSEGDQVVAFMKTSLGLKYQIKDAYVGKTYGYFSKVSSGSSDNLAAGMKWDHNVVYYPYSTSVECEKSGSNYTLNVALPSEQTYAPESFGNASFPMVAVSEDNDITFKNVCGGMKLQLKGTQKVKSITLQGKNNEKLSGAAIVMAYTDGETEPAITMASTASTTVTLNCTEAVQLNEGTATEFIITLPPAAFTKGFTATVTDDTDKTYTVETDRANTVLRSSILNMPAVNLGTSEGGESGGNESEGDVVPVGSVKLNYATLVLPTGFSYTLTAQILPVDATDQTPEWNSDNPTVVNVDQSGVITTMSAGTANISAVAGGVAGICTITVIAPTTREPIDYEVDGVSYGKGIVIGDVIWAPVNCGYEPATSDSKGYPYGKLYQWGRKYGQGYSTSYDATVPEIVEGPMSLVNGQKEKYSNTFFKVTESPYDWTSPQDDKLWNSGTESVPIKTEYDPCPKGWRVPTYPELAELSRNYWSELAIEDNQRGTYFSGDYTYLDNIPRVFLSYAGYRSGYDDGVAYNRGSSHYYWSSRSSGVNAYRLNRGYNSYMNTTKRVQGCSVRCVQE